jgi:hypothetical protein
MASDGFTPSSARASITPIWKAQRAEPPEKT